MCESHACGSKIVISRIQTNFSCLSDNSKCNCLKTFEKSSQHLWNSLVMLKIGWKSFGNCWRALFWHCRKSFYTFSYLRKSSGNLPKSSEILGNLQKSFENFGNLRKALVNLQKSRFCVDVKSRAFYWKKVGRYTVVTRAKVHNRPFARSGHMMQNKLCWDGNNAIGLSKQESQAGLVRVPLFWKSHSIVCVPAKFIPYHVTGSCKGPIQCGLH